MVLASGRPQRRSARPGVAGADLHHRIPRRPDYIDNRHSLERPGGRSAERRLLAAHWPPARGRNIDILWPCVDGGRRDGGLAVAALAAPGSRLLPIQPTASKLRVLRISGRSGHAMERDGPHRISSGRTNRRRVGRPWQMGRGRPEFLGLRVGRHPDVVAPVCGAHSAPLDPVNQWPGAGAQSLAPARIAHRPDGVPSPGPRGNSGGRHQQCGVLYACAKSCVVRGRRVARRAGCSLDVRPARHVR